MDEKYEDKDANVDFLYRAMCKLLWFSSSQTALCAFGNRAVPLW